jgi:single-strand DNA-binding protein
MSINRVILAGNLTRDPEVRSTASGIPVMQVGIAVNERVKNSQTDEWEDKPNFFDCTMFGSRAEAVSRYLSKGSKVAIEGKLRYSTWEKDGQKKSKVDVIIDEIEFMSGGQQSQPQAYVQQQYQPAPQYAPQAAPQQAYAPQYQQQAYAPQQQAYNEAYLAQEDLPF